MLPSAAAATPTSFDGRPMTDAWPVALAALAEGRPAVSFPLLGPEACETLLVAARRLPFRPARPRIGEGTQAVYQDFEINMTPPAESPLLAFVRWLNGEVGAALARLPAPPLPDGFAFNDLAIQRYRAGAAGITAHRDHVRYRGLIGLLSLTGRAHLYTCRDRRGGTPHEVDCTPGRLVLMPGPGFAGREERPFHFLNAVGAERYSLGIRCDRDNAQGWLAGANGRGIAFEKMG